MVCEIDKTLKQKIHLSTAFAGKNEMSASYPFFRLVLFIYMSLLWTGMYDVCCQLTWKLTFDPPNPASQIRAAHQHKRFIPKPLENLLLNNSAFRTQLD